MGSLINDTSVGNSGIDDAEEFVTLILEETPEALNAFGSREEMVQYVREAIQSERNSR